MIVAGISPSIGSFSSQMVKRYSRLLVILDKSVVSVKNNVLNTEQISINLSQLVFSLYLLNSALQDEIAYRNVIIGLIDLIHNHNYIHESENTYTHAYDIKPDVSMLHRGAQNFSFVRLLSGYRYFSIVNYDYIRDRYKIEYSSKSYNLYLNSVSYKDDQEFVYHVQDLMDELRKSNLKDINFLLLTYNYSSPTLATAAEYNYYAIRIRRESDVFIDFLEKCKHHVLSSVATIALRGILFKSENLKETINSNSIETNKKEIAKLLETSTETRNIRHRYEIFYNYTMNDEDRSKMLNKYGLCISIPIPSDSYTMDVFISTPYDSVDYFDISRKFLINTILDERTKVLYNKNRNYLLIV